MRSRLMTWRVKTSTCTTHKSLISIVVVDVVVVVDDVVIINAIRMLYIYARCVYAHTYSTQHASTHAHTTFNTFYKQHGGNTVSV